MSQIKSDDRIVVGISGRSGSGKSTVVKNLLERFGEQMISLHTMDNYYLPRDVQVPDSQSYLNFDLPTSFSRHQFFKDLQDLKMGSDVTIQEYVFNNERTPEIIQVLANPVILVEGLFIFHYEEIRNMIDLMVLIDVPLDVAFKRRLHRDRVERNYDEQEIRHRYHHHAEPAYQKYIRPYKEKAHIVVSNISHDDEVLERISFKILSLVSPQTSE